MTQAKSRPDKGVILLSWLVPITYLIHIAEEYWGGEGYPVVHLPAARGLSSAEQIPGGPGHRVYSGYPRNDPGPPV